MIMDAYVGHDTNTHRYIHKHSNKHARLEVLALKPNFITIRQDDLIFLPKVKDVIIITEVKKQDDEQLQKLK